MKGVTALSLAAALAIALAGCGVGHHTPGSAATVAASPQATSAASPVASSVSPATTNERLFANGIVASIPVIPGQVVAGAAMRTYARFEHAEGAAWGAVGQPFPSESVTQIAGGFKVCSADTGSGSGCEAFTQFTTNDAGQITGVSVNGQPVAGRIATAPAATSDGLTISGVAAYRLTADGIETSASSPTPVQLSPGDLTA